MAGKKAKEAEPVVEQSDVRVQFDVLRQQIEDLLVKNSSSGGSVTHGDLEALSAAASSVDEALSATETAE